MTSQPPLRWQSQLPSGKAIAVMVRPSAINLLVGDEEPSYTFDPAGRLYGAFQGGRNFRRSLDNRVLAKWSDWQSGRRRRQRRWLDAGEARVLVETAWDLARQAAFLSRDEAAPEPLQAALKRAAGWNWQALETDRRRFERIYTPIGILPPDQYLALVLQATHGCTHNACTFCTFYRDQAFRIKSPDEFRAHTTAVLDFFGPALAMRRSIFLADANALVIPMPRLLALLGEIRNAEHLRRTHVQVFRMQNSQAGGWTVSQSHRSPFTSLPLFAFVDAFHVHRKSVADWQELKGYGLQRVYIGMESGHDPLLRWLNKPGEAQDTLDAVTTLKAAGIQASVIILLGAGGDQFAAGHVADTVALLNAMPLGQGDLVYFSDFVPLAGAPYVAVAEQAGIRALDFAALRDQEQSIRRAFRPCDPSKPPQFSRYDIDEFIY